MEQGLAAGLEAEARAFGELATTDDGAQPDLAVHGHAAAEAPCRRLSARQSTAWAWSARASWARPSPRSARSPGWRCACATSSPRRSRSGLASVRQHGRRRRQAAPLSAARGRAKSAARLGHDRLQRFSQRRPGDRSRVRGLGIKHRVIERAGSIVLEPEAVIATNTSALPIQRDRQRRQAPRAHRRHALLLAGRAHAAARGDRPRRRSDAGRGDGRQRRQCAWARRSSSSATRPASTPRACWA